MFQKKIDELFIGMPNLFGIADDILIAGFDEWGKDHDETLEKVLQLYRQVNLKLNKDKCLLRCTRILCFSEIISWKDVIPDPRKVQVLTDMSPTEDKKEL